MLKLNLILLLFITISIGAYAQKLTADEKLIFDEVVYKRRKVGEYEILSKWVVPIRYKIYGDTSAYLVKEVSLFFNQLKDLTALDIRKAANDSEENFMIVFGEKPEDFETYTLTKKPLNSPGSYRIKSNKNSEIYWGQSLINTKAFGSRSNAKGAIRKSVIKTFGFINNAEHARNSVFYSRSADNMKIDDFDSHIISALYLPTIKPGMAKQEVDKILNP